MIDERYLRLLSEKFPNTQAVVTELINLRAILSLPKGTEHFVSDLHGESMAFIHMIKNASFVERQKRMIIDGEDYYLDLLFYHRKLRRLIAIDLKLGSFKAQYKGQMELYLRWLLASVVPLWRCCTTQAHGLSHDENIRTWARVGMTTRKRPIRSLLCCSTRTRTQTDRTRICSATITPLSSAFLESGCKGTAFL